MNMLRKELDFIVKGGLTKRYHTNDTIHQQNVAEHSFFVAWLIAMMYVDREDMQSLMCFALAHDVAEGMVGDVASPVKRANPQLKDLLDIEEERAWNSIGRISPTLDPDGKRCLKMVDNMEGMLFCVRERVKGNMGVGEIYHNFYQYTSALKPQGKELEMFNLIIQLWEECHVCQR